ncbi:uncharacterized protein LOC131640606 [Vicia villosa]|uniref:uncharacterized protein LOC131640606 n=1 Tax=Vicia villosa TaxID=3911 RepID=UPI00273BAED7|nr:uncharacterized protein LOC131640606 [Vicia villosa]
MVFCRGDSKSLMALSKLLIDYGNNSGQFCNLSKSLIYAGGMSFERHCSLANIIGFTKATPPFFHLGVPIFIGRPKACYFLKIADSIRLKMAIWKARLLSMAGRTQLIKSVIFGMTVHSITIYNWPSSIVKKIEGWMRNFVWSGSTDKKKIITVSWKECCKHHNEGGLGIISLRAYNAATNLHLCWRFLNNTQSWGKLLKARVKRNGDTIKYAIKSSIWTSIKEIHQTVLDNCSWLIGNGSNVNFWLDNWTGETLASKFHIPKQFHYALTSMDAVPHLLSSISSFSIPEVDFPDSFVWRNSTSGLLTIKDAYKEVIKPRPSVLWTAFPWDKDSPPSHSMIVWRVIHKKMTTDENIQLRGFSIPSICNLCRNNSETNEHLFFNCCFVKNIWNWLKGMLNLNFNICGMEDCIRIIEMNWSAQAMFVVKAGLVGVFYQVWIARNHSRFEDKQIHWKYCISLIAARLTMIGNSTISTSNSSFSNFTLLKNFNISIKPSKTLTTVNVLWTPPLLGWLKCNVDGVACGSLWTSACGGIFRDHNALHVLSFSAFLGKEPPETVEFLAVIMAIEKAMSLGISKLWIESDCILVVNAFKNHSLVPWKIKSRWLVCCADFLAGIGLRNKVTTWFNYIHEDIKKDYLLDKQGIPRIRLCR